MLPPGHIAGGYLAAYALLKLTAPHLPAEQTTAILALGTFFGFAPDLDMFVAFARLKKFTIDGRRIDHRKFYSHRPAVWLGLGLLIALFAQSTFVRYIGLAVWLGAWSHFALDSIEYGIMWLWPFNKKLYALKNAGVFKNIESTGFWPYWWNFLKFYATRLSFYLEIIVILTGVYFFFTHH